MNPRQDHLRILEHLYLCGASETPATLGLLARSLDLSRHETARAVLELDRAGLVDAARIRPTLSGLAVAVAIRSPTLAIASRSAAERGSSLREELAC